MVNTYTIIEEISAAIVTVFEVIGSGILWLGMFIGVILSIACWYFFLRRQYRTAQITLSLPFGLGNVVYEASDQDRVLAWKMYVQLKTRKAALLFDEEFDIISNVHDSLHDIFAVTRDLLSEIRPYHGETQKNIADFVLRVLNDGIRPHLTQWHAAFRGWWDNANTVTENSRKSPGDLQKEFPQHKELVSDLKRMNDELAKYAEELLEVVHAIPGKTKDHMKAMRIEPEQPKVGCGPLKSESTSVSKKVGQLHTDSLEEND